jgi:hypothetical protein
MGQHVVYLNGDGHRFGPKGIRKVGMNHHHPCRVFEGSIDMSEVGMGDM